MRTGNRAELAAEPPKRSWRVEAPSRPGHGVPAARSSGYLGWTQVGSLRSPGDPSCAFAPLLDPGRTDVPSPWRSHRWCPRFVRQRRLRTMWISVLTHAALGTCSPTLRAQGWLPAGWPLPGGHRTLWITTKGFRSCGHPLSCPPDATHVPYESLVELRAAYMPDATRAVSGFSRVDPEDRSLRNDPT
jgi:hypothetical protein